MAEAKKDKEMAEAKKDNGAADSGARQDALIAEQLKRQRKVRIRIASGREAHERCPVPVAVNGREFLIERDKEVEVPEGVVNVLMLANMQVAETTDSGGMVNTTFHNTARFSLTVLGPVEAADGAAQ